jgi:hypothetical protein
VTQTLTATFVRDLPASDWRGTAKLWRLSSPHTHEWFEDSTVTFDHVITSAANVPFSGPETYVFAANEDGKVVDWNELPGSLREELDHDRALNGFLDRNSD